MTDLFAAAKAAVDTPKASSADAAASRDAELVAWLRDQTWSSFAQSLANFYDAKGYLTDKQAASGASMRRKCEAKRASGSTSSGRKPNDFDVPEGRYAVRTDDGALNEIAFYQVDRPTEGKWAGRVYVKRLLGAPGTWRRERLGYKATLTILGKIEDAGVEAAGMLFATEAKACRRCGAALSNDESRASGYGSTCITYV